MKTIRYAMILEFYGAKDIQEFVLKYYVDMQMSCRKIVEMVFNDTGIKITAQTIAQWVKVNELQRDQRIAYNLSLPDYTKRSEVDYLKDRKIHYSEFQDKKMEVMKRNIPGGGFWAFHLKDILLLKNKTPNQLAAYITSNSFPITVAAVQAWLSLNNRCNIINHKLIMDFTKMNFKSIFLAKDVSQENIKKLKIKDFNTYNKSTLILTLIHKDPSGKTLSNFVTQCGSIKVASHLLRLSEGVIEFLLFKTSPDASVKETKKRFSQIVSDDRKNVILLAKNLYNKTGSIDEVVKGLIVNGSKKKKGSNLLLTSFPLRGAFRKCQVLHKLFDGSSCRGGDHFSQCSLPCCK